MADTPSTPKPAAKLQKRHMLPTGVQGIDVTPDGRTIFAACQDGVYTLDLTSGERKHLYNHESWVSGVEYFEPSKTLVSAGYDGALTWYDVAAGKPIRTVKAHQFWSWQLARSADGKYIASATGQYLVGGPKYEPAPEREPSVKVFDAATGAQVHAFSHVPSVQSVTFSPDSRYVAAGNLMGEVRTWDVRSGQQVSTIKTDAFTSWGVIKNHHYIGGIYALQFSPDGEQLFLAGMGPMVDPMAGNGRQRWQRWAWKAEAKLIDQTPEHNGEGLMESLALHPTAPYFVMAGRLRGGTWNTAFFDLKDGSLLHFLNTDSRITKARFTADGARLLLGGMKSQPGFNKEGVIPDWGHVDVYEISA